ncbi:MAG: hypothetical protein L0241_19615, partial [Planctomycetia bacterium]|nr:hypothetical protein [Planctomycetia bacterium]
MSGLKSGGLLLMLAIPFAAYVAWQVNGVTRADLIVSDPPPDKGATNDQLSAGQTKASGLVNETRKVESVTLQFRAPGAQDAVNDPAAVATRDSAAKRSANLTDLGNFLSGVERPVFTGELKNDFENWQKEQVALRKAEQEIKDALIRMPEITSSADAERAMEALEKLVRGYLKLSRFADNGKAALWRIKARIQVIEELTKLADKQYKSAISVKLPLKPGDNEVLTAVKTLKGQREQIKLLTDELKQAEEDKIPLDGPTTEAIKDKGQVADECSAREELLALFGKDDLFTNPNGAAWLKLVLVQYRKTKDDNVKVLIRRKVQEFCEEFIPLKVRLDEKVIFKKNTVQRSLVIVKYQEKGDTKPVPLSSEVEGLNELNLADRYPPKTTRVVYDMGGDEFVDVLKPTEHSKAAKLYFDERKKLADSATGPKWTLKAVEELKKKCDSQSKWVDQLWT